MKFLLKLFSLETLWKEILNREGFSDSAEVEALSVWQQVYYRVPEVKDYFKRREISLLKSSALLEKPSLFILGQIFENRLWQRFDVPQGALPKKVEPVEIKIPQKEKFLGTWGGKSDADANKENVQEETSGGVPRNEAQPSENSG